MYLANLCICKRRDVNQCSSMLESTLHSIQWLYGLPLQLHESVYLQSSERIINIPYLRTLLDLVLKWVNGISELYESSFLN